MSEEAIIVEVEPESIKPQHVDVKVSSSVLNEEIQDSIINYSEHSNVVVKENINSVKDEYSSQKDVKERLLWDEKMIGSNEPDGHHVRRHSASLLFGQNRKAGVPSRYRGGSIGSCHDMCKFGHHKNTSEVKPKSYRKKTPLLNNESGDRGLMKTARSVENGKRSVVRRLSFPEAKAVNESQTHVGEVTLSGKEMPEPKEMPAAAESVEIVKEEEADSLGEDELKPLESSSNDFREIKVVKDVEKPNGLASATLRSKPPVKKAASVSSRIHRDPSSSSQSKNHPTNRQQEGKAKIHENVSSSSQSKNHPNNRQQEGTAKLHENVPEKTLYMIEPNSKSMPVETSQKAPLHRKRLPKTQGGSYSGTEKGIKATQNGSDNSRLAKSSLPSSKKALKSKNEKLDDTELVIKHTDTVNGHQKSKSSTQGATSYTRILKPGAPKAKQNGRRESHLIKSLLPAIDKPSPSQEEEPAGTESVLSKHGDAHKTKPRTPKAKPGTPKVKQDTEPKAKATRGAKSQNGEGEGLSSVWKMKFRRGKVISLPSANNSPVKLKFRRPRSLIDNRHAENAGNVNYKNKEADGEDPQKDGAEPVKVVLRRHEATYKKDDVDLNNVIEETASKLVKTRKSKVKALVGAFETVMSLRDRKASETTDTP